MSATLVQKPQEKVYNGHKANDSEICMSVSSVDNGRLSSRDSNDLDFDTVSTSSPSTKFMLCGIETMPHECEESKKIHCPLLPLSIFDSGNFSSRTSIESDCNEEQFSHSQSAAYFSYYYCKKVSIGPEAKIPPRRPEVCIYNPHSLDLIAPEACRDNDIPHRLLGNCVWPLAGSNSELEDHYVGQGKSTNCECPDQNSICRVKEHIQAKREKLKLNLGKGFSLLGFDDMGENVSKKWMR